MKKNLANRLKPAVQEPVTPTREASRKITSVEIGRLYFPLWFQGSSFLPLKIQRADQRSYH